MSSPIKEHDSSEEASDAKFSPRQTLNQAVYSSLSPVAFGIGILNFALGFGHFMVLTESARTIMVCLAFGSGLFLIGLHLLLKKSPAYLKSNAHLVALAGVAVLTLNSLTHIALTGEEKHSTNVAIILIAVGCFFMSMRWLVPTLSAIVVAWMAVVFTYTTSPDWVHFGFMNLVAFVLAITVHHVRKHLVLDKERAVYEQTLHAQEFQQQSLSDGLTKIGNRLAFEQNLDREWRRAARNHVSVSLLMVDVDRFKQFNDLYGHPKGDECLIIVAATLKKKMNRPGDCLARYGGEEFAVILPDTDHDGALIVAEKIRQAMVDKRIFHNENDARVVTLSIGVATMDPHRNIDPESLVQTADKALYEAKAKGRNRVEGTLQKPMSICNTKA